MQQASGFTSQVAIVVGGTTGMGNAVVRQLVAAGQLLDVPVYDHVIVAGDRFLSFATAGLL